MLQKETESISKESIKNRMFKNAAKLWGLADADIDKFDPIVGLLIEACSVEVYKVLNEINLSETRVLERLAHLLAPETLTCPLPAHAVVHARSLEPEYILSPLTQFYYPQQSNEDRHVQDVYFSPAGNYKAVDGDIKFIATGANIFSVNESGGKEFFVKTLPGKRIENNCICIGISLNPKIDSLENTAFYFDWKNTLNKDNLYQNLSFSKWTIGNIPLSTVSGIHNPGEKEKKERQKNILDEFNSTYILEKQVNNFYRGRFISFSDSTLNSTTIQSQKRKVSSEMESCIARNDLQKFTENLLWIKILFPTDFTADILDSASVSMNCFPILNRRLNQLRYKLQTHINIVPLASIDQFLSIKSIQGSDGQEYVSSPVHNNALLDKGTYSVREGIARFNGGSARVYLEYLTELLRDESSAFSAIGRDSISSYAKEINQNIALIEQKILQSQSSPGEESGTFLHIKPLEEGDTIAIEFWTTNAEQGNRINNGNKLDLYYNSELHPESIRLMSNTVKGRNRLRNAEMISVYKSALINRGRLVTTEDIRTFCFAELGDKLKEVEIKKGIAIGNSKKEGFIRTIDIYLKPGENSLQEEEWSALKHDLQLKIEQQSMAIGKYRVFLAGSN